MFRILSIVLVALVGAAPLLAQAPRPNTANDLKQIGLAFHSCIDATGKAPQKADDLVPYLDKNQKLIGDYVFIYGVGILQMTQGTSNTVVGYEKDVPTKGGFALYGDGSVKRLTAEEFKKVILAKKP
jgi:hypothetical protein